MTPSEARRVFVPVFRRQNWATYAVCVVVMVTCVAMLVMEVIG